MFLIGCAIFFALVHFKLFWKVIFFFLVRSLHLLGLVMLITIPLGFLSSGQFFIEHGWTPISVLFGKDFYNGVVVGGKKIVVKNGVSIIK